MPTVNVTTPDGDMAVYDAVPAGAVRGGVVVVQEAFGVNAHIEDVAGRFAAAGYRAVAPHLFHRTGDPVLDYDDLEQIWPHMKVLERGGIGADLDAAIAYLRDAGIDASSTGVVGFCMGGTVAFLAATRGDVGAAVTFYGGGVAEGRFGLPPLVELAAELRSPWLGLYGDQDQGIPVDQVEALAAAVAEVEVETEIVRYEDAGHGFQCDARPGSYEPGAAADGWARTLAWFDTHLAGPASSA
jgi:carboxymethylenebutenolidase